MPKKTLIFGCDHAGFSLKKALVEHFEDVKDVQESLDVGVFSEDRVDYPDIADIAIRKMRETSGSIGILVCGSGQGMCIRANRYPEIRATLCLTVAQAELVRQHNDANVLCLAGRLQAPKEAIAIIETFVNTEFSGGRHADRVAKLSRPVT
jgi:RpiB/LacA/LacB family sugar-phosphate isomerase